MDNAAGPPLRIAVIGFGYWGPNVARNVFALPNAELAAICDRRPSALNEARRRFPSVSMTDRLDRVLEDASIDGCIIATPVGTHARIARAAIEAGKHVLVEKPLAASSVDAFDLIDCAAAAGVVLMPGHTFLYSPPVNSIRQLIDSGDLGEIYFISSSRVNLGIHQQDVSVLWDLGPHDFSILRYWLNESPIAVASMSRDCVGSGTPDVAFLNLEYASETIAHVELSWLAPSKLRRTTVVGSRKMVVYDDTSVEPVRIFDAGVNLRDPRTFGEYRLTYRTGDIVSPRVEPSEPLFLELADFLRAVRTGSTPRSHARLGLEVVLLIEAAERSLAAGGSKISTEIQVPAWSDR